MNADFGGRLRWQSGFVLWRVDLFKRAYWGQWRTELWLGHVYVCWLWPFGFYREGRRRKDWSSSDDH